MDRFDLAFYTSEFAQKNMMGPNSLRIIDELLDDYKFEKGIRILDLGCGRGLTSILLAQKYDATVFAVDLWIEATENYERFKSISLEEKIVPIHANAFGLPFANDYFDAVVSIDSYHYYGCEPDYLSKHLLPLVKKNGKIFIGIPGLQKEFSNEIPEELVPFWENDMNLHSCGWWINLWAKESAIRIDECYEMKCMKEAWADWLMCKNEHAERDIEMMKAEGGKYFNLVGIKATKIK
jgi:cyclopropane fatty-acyl-phospholipid synthase-like methyltransferase